MTQDNLDKIIEDKLAVLREEKYKLRTFEVQLDIQIDAEVGVEESLQAIRSIEGVTVVTAMESLYRGNSSTYSSHIKIKFHPKRDSMSAGKYMTRTLIPGINGKNTPGVKILRLATKPERIK